MGKQFNLSKIEQDEIGHVLMSMATMLLSKMDEGVDEPEIEGSLKFKEQNRIVEFSFKAKPIS